MKKVLRIRLLAPRFLELRVVWEGEGEGEGGGDGGENEKGDGGKGKEKGRWRVRGCRIRGGVSEGFRWETLMM